jgi:MFS family permease
MNSAYPAASRANYTLIVLVGAYILSFVDRQIVNLLVGPIRADLRISDFQMSLLQGLAFALFYVTLGLPIGRLADRKNRKAIIAAGILVWSLMTSVCGLATTFLGLFIARIGVGVGEAALSPAAYSILGDSFPKEKLARAIYIYTLGTTVGAGLAYLIGGSVIEHVASASSIVLPLVGSVQPWQATFFIVGLPGLLIALLVWLTVEEPSRRGVVAATGAAATTPTINEVMHFAWQRRRAYLPIFLSISLLSILSYGYMNWYPAFLTRTYGLTTADAGRSIGVLYLVFGTAGAFSGAGLSEYFTRRGHSDANVRVIAVVCAALLVPAAVGPMMPDATLALIVAAPTVLLLNAFFGASVTALQLMTPNQMRALISAAFLLFTTLTGLGIGTSLVALFTDYVFGSDLSLRYSLASVAVLVCPIATAISVWGLEHYRAVVRGERVMNGPLAGEIAT